jgi:hypothetical protein
LAALRDELLGAIRDSSVALRDELMEAVRDSETKLLKAFYTFAESNQQRISQVEASNGAVIARLATLESRITIVEKHLNLPPAA